MLNRVRHGHPKQDDHRLARLLSHDLEPGTAIGLLDVNGNLAADTI